MIWERLRKAGLIAGAAFLSAAPYTYYVSVIAFPDRVKRAARAISEQELLEVDLSRMALIVVIASIVGTFFSERYGLGGLGDAKRVRRAWPFMVAALAVGTASYFIFGARLAAAVPGYYPETIGWAIALMIKNAVFDEIVARYGMMTIVAGVAKKQWMAILLQAIFFTAVGYRSMGFYGVDAALNVFVVGGLIASVGVHCALGHVYARHGLFAACSVHLALEVERLIHVVWR